MSTIVNVARTWLGVRWQHQGRSRHGVDCVGLVVEVTRVTHGNTVNPTDYAVQATDESMLHACREHMTEVPLADMAPGHVVLMRFDNQRHMGILGDYPQGLSLIHAYAISRKVVEHRLDSVWRNRIFAAFEVRGAA